MSNLQPVRRGTATRVMIADDSVVVRGLLRKMVEKSGELEIVATVSDGMAAVREYKTSRPDVVLMDVEMPHLDGLSALKEVLAFDPHAKVIMCSSLTQSGAKTALEALQIGAIDCLAKPSSKTVDRGVTFESELLSKLRAFGGNGKPLPSMPRNGATATMPVSKLSPSGSIALQPFPQNLSNRFPLALVIGASTGGPKALIDVLQTVNKKLMLPIFITQHIPENFSQYLAENIARRTSFPTHEAQEGMPVQPGHIYLAPGRKHMGVTPGADKRITLIDSPPVNFCKPSIDVMLRSINDAYSGHLLTLLLTGMGADGKEACRALIQNGKHNILVAQDEATSVVWGIPGAVAKEGLCHAVLPLDEIGAAVNRLVERKPPVVGG